MRLFNSFQIVTAFVAWPFGISWLACNQTFSGATAAFYAACVLYLVAFFSMVGCVFNATKDWE